MGLIMVPVDGNFVDGNLLVQHLIGEGEALREHFCDVSATVRKHKDESGNLVDFFSHTRDLLTDIENLAHCDEKLDMLTHFIDLIQSGKFDVE